MSQGGLENRKSRGAPRRFAAQPSINFQDRVRGSPPRRPPQRRDRPRAWRAPGACQSLEGRADVGTKLKAFYQKPQCVERICRRFRRATPTVLNVVLEGERLAATARIRRASWRSSWRSIVGPKRRKTQRPASRPAAAWPETLRRSNRRATVNKSRRTDRSITLTERDTSHCRGGNRRPGRHGEGTAKPADAASHRAWRQGCPRFCRPRPGRPRLFSGDPSSPVDLGRRRLRSMLNCQPPSRQHRLCCSAKFTLLG